MDATNHHRMANLIPSDTTSVDESSSHWYGLGEDWSVLGLPHYVALERKLENGCEMKSAACGTSGDIIRLQLVKPSEDTRMEKYEKDYQHGIAVTLRLVETWIESVRVVCGDSAFPSARTALNLKIWAKICRCCQGSDERELKKRCVRNRAEDCK